MITVNNGGDAGSAARVQAMVTSSSTVDAGNAAPKPRPGGGMKWSEVCERVQQPDGSVRTSPRIKSGITSTVSPPRPRPARDGLGKLGRLSGSGGSLPTTGSSGGPSSSRGSCAGSSRGASSGKSSRSSSLDGSQRAREGDISSRCSSGCWDTCTNSSSHSRPGTPACIIPSPSGANSLLMMPDPIRTAMMLPASLLDDETVHVSESKLEGTCVDEVVHDPVQDPVQDPVDVSPCFDSQVNQVTAEPQPGPICFKWDPYGRDVPRRNCEVKGEWSVEPLVKYLRRVVTQIDANIEQKRVPTAEKFDAFVARLMANTHRLLKHTPKKMRQTLQGMLSRRFQRFWNFARSEKVRSATPEELKSMLTCLIEALVSEFGVSPHGPDVLINQYTMSPERQEPQPGRLHVQHHQRSPASDPHRRGAAHTL